MRRIALSDEQFRQLADLLKQSAGLAFDATRRESLAYSVGERMHATGSADVFSYLELVSGADGATAIAPMDAMGCESNTGCHTRPASIDFHTPPFTAPK